MKVHFHDCKGKRRFHDAEEAKRALRHIKTRGEPRAKTPARYYECPLCHGFHLTAKADKYTMGADQASEGGIGRFR